MFFHLFLELHQEYVPWDALKMIKKNYTECYMTSQIVILYVKKSTTSISSIHGYIANTKVNWRTALIFSIIMEVR